MQVLNDNGPQSLSRESKRFANEWLFEHVASSLYHPIAWPRIRPNLLCKSTKNGSGPSIGLLNLRNVPKDQTLGSPAPATHVQSFQFHYSCDKSSHS